LERTLSHHFVKDHPSRYGGIERRERSSHRNGKESITLFFDQGSDPFFLSTDDDGHIDGEIYLVEEILGLPRGSIDPDFLFF